MVNLRRKKTQKDPIQKRIRFYTDILTPVYIHMTSLRGLQDLSRRNSVTIKVKKLKKQ